LPRPAAKEAAIQLKEVCAFFLFFLFFLFLPKEALLHDEVARNALLGMA
jgi:hypothetical protein